MGGTGGGTGIGDGGGGGIGTGITALVENYVLVEIAINNYQSKSHTKLLVGWITQLDEIVDSFRHVFAKQVDDDNLVSGIHSGIYELNFHPDRVCHLCLT